jgi:hypothetical protein
MNQPGNSAGLSALAGGAIGLLVGIAAGLSTAPVVAVIVGAISTGLLILLGLKKDSPADTGTSDAAMVARIAAFGIVCSVALVLGVLARAHDVLSPTPTKMEQQWKAAGFSEQQAREIVMYEKLGLTSAKVEGKEGGLVANRPALAGAAAGNLFASSSTAVCPYFDRHNYGTTDDMLYAMKLQHGALEQFAAAVEKAGSSQRDAIVDAAGGLLCGH